MFVKHADIQKERVGRIDASSGIVIDGVSKDYGTGALAVKPMYLKIERGEFFSLLGSSGSGKTTTLKMLSGLEFPTKGIITLEGVDVTHMPANRRDVHTVFQNYALFPHMSVAKNVAYGLEGRRMGKASIRERVANMLELVGLAGHEDDKPDSLSGGMQQRVALARALVLEPKALLLDEPLGALDLKLRHHMQQVLKDIHREVGITFVYVTHDQEEAFAMSDRIGVMTAGELVQVSSPEAMYRRPKSSFIADFVGASNMLQGTVEEVRDRCAGVYQVRFHELGKTAVVQGVSSLSAGDRVLGVVRPQDVRVGEGSSESGFGLVMQLEERVFLGGYTKVKLKAGDLSMTADVSRSVPADMASVPVSWKCDDVWVVAA